MATPVRAQLQAALDAHGGLDTWQQYGTLEYDLQREEGADHQLIDLTSRQVRITSDQYTIGFDGEQVWITPSIEALTYGASPRFYSRTYFYFFAMPFVFADPGVNAEPQGQHALDGTTYDVVRVTYGENVGDSPDDVYLAYFDAGSHRLHMVRYTVTYGGRDPGEPNSVIVYDEWQQVDGLLVPAVAHYHQWKDGTLGDPVAEVRYQNVDFHRERPDASLFEKPASAVVDSLPDSR